MIEKVQGSAASSTVPMLEALRAAIAHDKQELETLRQDAKNKLVKIDAVKQNEAKYLENSINAHARHALA